MSLLQVLQDLPTDCVILQWEMALAQLGADLGESLVPRASIFTRRSRQPFC